jgi:hypothetical protein
MLDQEVGHALFRLVSHDRTSSFSLHIDFMDYLYPVGVVREIKLTGAEKTSSYAKSQSYASCSKSLYVFGSFTTDTNRHDISLLM